MYGVVSGMWQSMISLGAWIGPSVGGALYDTIGFRHGSWLVFGVCFIACVSILIHAAIKHPEQALKTNHCWKVEINSMKMLDQIEINQLHTMKLHRHKYALISK